MIPTALGTQGTLRLRAPAKVNLFLGIGAVRPDGYHNAVSVMHSLSLHDVIALDYLPHSEGGLCIELACHAREGLPSLDVADEGNICCKALRLLAQNLGRIADETVSVRLEKHIPHQAGLGGGSSDAAAILVGAAHLWNLAPDAPELLATARDLGADVPFFLHGGCAYLTGVGGTLVRRLAPSHKPVVLVKPSEGISTAAAYRAFDEEPRLLADSVYGQAAQAACADEVPLADNLAAASATLLPKLEEVSAWLEGQAGVEGVLLCGSGSATFAVCGDFGAAHRIAAAARRRFWWSRTTSLSPTGAALISARP